MYYAFDEFGRYTGTTDTPSSNTTDHAPPTQDTSSNWTGQAWVIADLPNTPIVHSMPLAEPVPIAPSWAEQVAETRYQHEIAGVQWQGFLIATDRDSQAKLASEVQAADKGWRADGDLWKCVALDTGAVVFRPTTNAELLDLGQRVSQYIRACYARESSLIAEGEGATLETGWPDPTIAI